MNAVGLLCIALAALVVTLAWGVQDDKTTMLDCLATTNPHRCFQWTGDDNWCHDTNKSYREGGGTPSPATKQRFEVECSWHMPRAVL